MLNKEFLQQKILEKFANVEAFASALEVSKQAVYQWLKDKAAPDEKRLFDIVSLLDLNESEIDRLMGIPETVVSFRKKHLSEPDEDIHLRSIDIAETFFKIDGSSYVVKSGILMGVTGGNASSIADYIRRLVNIEADEPVRFGELLVELRKHNINVFFFPFQKLGLSLTATNAREVAFTARKGSRAIIFVDTDRTLDEATFDICHELTHLIIDEDNGTETERLCNSVAQELVYPTAFLRNHSGALVPFLNAKTYSWSQTVESFSNLEREFDWCPLGLAMTLKEHAMLKANSHEYKRLMALQKTFRKGQKTIGELHFSNFKPDDFDQLVQFFEFEVQKDKELYKPLIRIKDAAAFGRISPRRVSEILNIDTGDADELVRAWIAEHEIEDGQDDDNASHAQ